VALAVGARSGIDGHAARGMYPHLGAFPEARLGSERPHHGRGREPAGFDVGRKTDAQELGACARLGEPLGLVGAQGLEVRDRSKPVVTVKKPPPPRNKDTDVDKKLGKRDAFGEEMMEKSKEEFKKAFHIDGRVEKATVSMDQPVEAKPAPGPADPATLPPPPASEPVRLETAATSRRQYDFEDDSIDEDHDADGFVEEDKRPRTSPYEGRMADVMKALTFDRASPRSFIRDLIAARAASDVVRGQA